MSWLKLDDCFPTNGKVIGLSHRAFRLHVTALCYCAQNLTDGVVAKAALPIVGAYSGKGKPLTDELETARLWLPIPEGWEINGYLDLNPSKVDIEKRRAEAKAAAETRWSRKPKEDAERNAERIADGSTDGNALPSHPIPAVPPVLQSVPFPVVTAGTDSSMLGKLCRACAIDDMDSEDAKKLERAMRGLPEAQIIDLAYNAPKDVRDRLGWTLSELKKRKSAA